MSKNDGKTIAEVKNNAVGELMDYGQMAGEGFEGTTTADLSIPFISILQSNSPQIEEDNPKGCKVGQLINTVTNELTNGDEGQPFLPVHFEHAFVEWKPRDAGGGLVKVYDPIDESIKAFLPENGRVQGKIILPSKNELIETYYAYGLTLNRAGTATVGFAVASFTSTKIKPFRDWKTAMYMIKGKPPLFANRALLKTVKQKNEKGTYYNYDIIPLIGASWAESLINPKTEAQLLVEAKEFREAIMSGIAKPAFETQNTTGDGGGGSDSDAPF